jgi:CBS domain-containing protein
MCEKSTTLYEAEALMQRKNVNRLPVVEKKGSKEVIGIINFDTIHSNLLTNFAKNWIKRKQ